MQVMKLTIAGIAAPLILVVSSCFLGFGKQPAAEPKATNSEQEARALSEKGEVRPDFQFHMLQSMTKHEYPEAWGLFSDAGYLDNGQVIVYRRKAQNAAAREWVDRGQDKIQGPADLATDTFATFAKSVAEASHLQDYKPTTFDAIRYEYVHARRNDAGNLEIVQRVFMNNPPAEPESPYRALVQAFPRT